MVEIALKWEQIEHHTLTFHHNGPPFGGETATYLKPLVPSLALRRAKPAHQAE